MAQAILESLIAAFTPALYLRNASTINGNYNTFWESGAMTFTIVVIVVNLKVSSFTLIILTSPCPPPDDVCSNAMDANTFSCHLFIHHLLVLYCLHHHSCGCPRL